VSVPVHQIRSETVEFTFLHRDDATRMGVLMVQLCDRLIMAEVESALSAASPHEEDILFIDRIELDLGVITQKDILNPAEGGLAAVLRGKMTEWLHRQEYRYRSSDNGVVRKEGTSRVVPEGPDGDREVHSYEADDIPFLVVRHFLENGVLPWWVQEGTGFSIEETFLVLIRGNKERAIRLLLSTMNSPVARARAVCQFSHRTLGEMAGLLAEPNLVLADHVLPALWVAARTAHVGSSKREFYQIYWDALFTVLSSAYTTQGCDVSPNNLVQALVESMQIHSGIPEKELQRFYSAAGISDCSGRKERRFAGADRTASAVLPTRAGKETYDEDPHLVPDQFGQVSQKPAITTDTSGIKGEGKLFRGRPKKPFYMDQIAVSSQSHRPSLLPPEDVAGVAASSLRVMPGMHGDIRISEVSSADRDGALLPVTLVGNSGLVLLWPHLKTFFGALGLVRNDAFTSHGAVVNAIHLLQYAATSETSSPEHLLPLNKVLCGWDATSPIHRHIRLGLKARQEADGLLDAVIIQWTSLGKTSIEGFRQSFLRRQDILSEREENWLLKVERKPYDVLLERLPWVSAWYACHG
jgi:hypothetical protein